MNAITDVMNVYITLANPLKKMIVSESVAEVVVVEDDEEKESEVVVVEDDDEKEAEVVVVEDDEEKEAVVATESESESEEKAEEESEEDDDEKEAERLALEATRNLNAIREAKRVAKEKKSMKAKITEYRAEFIGNNNLAKAENNSEIARILAEIEILKREKTLMGERIFAINRGEYDEEILARKLEENAPKKKSITKRNACGGNEEKGEKLGKKNWATILGSSSRIRYGLHTDRGDCVYGLATLRADKSGLITPTDKYGNPHNWATKTTPLPNSWTTLSGFVRSVLIHNDATACKRNAFGWAGRNTPFGEYLDRSDGLWKPLANLVLGDKIN